MEKTMKKMIEVKSGIEHLADKLHHLKGVCLKKSSPLFDLNLFIDQESSTNRSYIITIK
jgi:hypothetical protein